jgi:hypothetical protein
LAEQTGDSSTVEIVTEDTTSLRETTPSLSLNDTLPATMNFERWKEDKQHFPPFEITTIIERSQVIFPKRLCRTETYYSSGLSPNCKAAFYLGLGGVVVYSLERFLPKIGKDDVLLRRQPNATENYDVAIATLTNRFLAITCQSNDSRSNRLLVFEHSPPGTPGTANTLSVGETLHIHPTCLAMHESEIGIWVVVGGRIQVTVGRRSHMAGKIQVYQVKMADGIIRLKRQAARFMSKLNSLLEDWPKTIDFSPDGERLVCITQMTNKVLVWSLDDQACPQQAAFEIMKTYDTVGFLVY